MTWPFENNTETLIKRLARRSMEADYRRSAFVILTIALAVCLMGTLCFLYSAKQLQTREKIQGQYQAGCIGMTREEIERLAGTGAFKEWGYTAGEDTIHYQTGTLCVAYVDPGMINLMDYDSITGTYPQSGDELCVERSFLNYYELPDETGQRISLNLGSGEKVYTITGILESENDSREFIVWISETAALASGNPAPYELRFHFAESEIVDAAQLRSDIDAFFDEMGIAEDRRFYSSNYFDMAELYLGNGMEIYILAALIAVVCAIVIYNIFYISVMEKMREYGRLKVLGATSKQLKQVIRQERRFLTIVAIPPGLAAAAVLTWSLMPGYWAWADHLVYAAVISVFTYLIVLIATRTPLKLAGSVSAIEAVKTTAYSQQQGRSVSRQLHRRLTMQRLALMNFSRSRKKAVVTTLSLSLTGILLLCIAAYTNSIDAREMALSQFGDHSDYLLQYEDYAGKDFVDIQRENPLGAALQKELAAIPGVDYIAAYNLACVEIPAISAIPGNREHEPFIVRGIPEKQMSDMYAGDAVLSGTADYQTLLAQDGILVCTGGATLKTVYKTSCEIGDKITVSCYNGQAKIYTVMGIVENIPIGNTAHFFILPEEELAVLYPEIADFTGYVNIHVEEDSEQLRRAVFSTASDERITLSALSDRVAALSLSLRQEMIKFYAILMFIFVFALINLANTLITNLLSRQQEFGIFQSVGMSSRQLSQMLSLECLYYIGLSMLVTLTAGTACSWMVCHFFNYLGIFGHITYRFPTAQVLLFAASLLAVQAVFSACAIRYSKKLSLVERIKAIS